MSSLHPHWDSEGEEVPVTVRTPSEGSESIPENAKTISRQPAAIVGMLVVMAIGYIFVQGVESLTGQVASDNTSTTVHITDNGLDPARLEVEHGQTITWVNEQGIPHILESDTLCSDTGFCLQTKTLFEGESDNFTITLDIPAGTYAYTSATSASIEGEIVITTTATEDFREVTSLLDNDFFGNTPVDSPFDAEFNNQAPAPIPTPSPAQQNTITTSVNTQQNIPRNPYTADSTRIHPFDGQGNPIESAFDDIPQQEVTAPPMINSNGRSPIRQPETGAGGLWFIVFGSIAMLWHLSRHCFRKTYQF